MPLGRGSRNKKESSPELKRGTHGIVTGDAASGKSTSAGIITDDVPTDAREELSRKPDNACFLVAGIPLDDAPALPATSKDENDSVALNDDPILIKPVPKSFRSRLYRSPKVSLRSDTSTPTKADSQNQEEKKSGLLHESLPQGSIEWLKSRIEKLEGELQDVAAVEAALYSVIAEHGSSSLKVHTPARRLVRIFKYVCKYGSEERRASFGKNMVAGLITTVRACGNDIPRLTFWCSNATILRETIAMDCNLNAPNTKNIDDNGDLQQIMQNSANTLTHIHMQDVSASHTIADDWTRPTTLIIALERIEAWIFANIVDSIWWEVLIPHMQRPVAANSTANSTANVQTCEFDRNISIVKSVEKRKATTSRMFVGKQGATSIQIWKKAFQEVYEKLCPIRVANMQCGCLPTISKMVMEACLVKLDIAMFNAVLRGNADQAPTNPVLDPISNYGVLPIIINKLSFGVGAQLKNAIGTLCEWLANLLNRHAHARLSGCILEEDKLFPTLKALGDLLMLPKHTLLDGSLRNEVCPLLSSSFMARILAKFEPDEFAAETVPLELIDSLNTDAEAMFTQLARAPPTLYVPPDAVIVRQWIGEPMGHVEFGRSISSVLRKGSASDDEMDEMESPIVWLLENTQGLMVGDEGSSCWWDCSDETSMGTSYRFQLLREAWTMM